MGTMKVKTTPNPITVFYDGRHVTPVRGIVYRKVSPIKGFNPEMVGKIRYQNRVVYVKRVGWGWESIANLGLTQSMDKIY